jgi:aspartate kinase
MVQGLSLSGATFYSSLYTEGHGLTTIVVQKYGGSSVADVAGIQRVAARIAATRAQGKQVCVVVSAMGKTTDELLTRARAISVAPNRRELDMLLTCGERASMALLSMAVSELGYEAISFTGSQSGILTNDRHSGARIIEVRPHRVQDELDSGKVVIIAGFQGVSYKREITTLGRGGSDTTAVAMAGALGAEYCEICSDVDGVYTADPRLVSAAELLDAISHDEMLELSAHGAKVLHPECVEFARRAGVALYARATVSKGPGTRIDARGAADQRTAGVTGKKPLVRVQSALGGAVLGVLAEASVPILRMSMTPGEDAAEAVEAWFGLDDVPDWSRVRDALVMVAGEDAIAESLGAVSAVGHGLGAGAATLARVRALCSEAGIEVQGVESSPLRITVFCRAGDVDALVIALHRALIETPGQERA